MKKIYFPLFISFLLLCGANCYAQDSWKISGKSLIEIQQESKPIFQSSFLTKTLLLKPTPSTTDLPNLTQLFKSVNGIMEMPKAYSYHQLGFFCKLEVQMERKASFPVKFRLGEVQYVERMEGKY